MWFILPIHKSLQGYLLEMADDLIAPNDKRDPYFFFHAKDLWHGSGFFQRKQWALKKRLEILEHLADIPRKFKLPIVYSCLRREDFVPKDLRGKARAKADSKCHATCFLNCLSIVDQWISQNCPDEQAFAIIEHHQTHKGSLQLVAETLSDPRTADEIRRDDEMKWEPLNHFVETPLFAEKNGSSPLQIADVCAFILNKALAGAKHSEHMLKKIEPQLVTGFRYNFFETPDQDPETFS